MSIFKHVNDKINDFNSLKELLEYVTNTTATKMPSNIGAKGCNKNALLRDMMTIKKAYHKNDGRFYEHVVLSITPDREYVPDSDYMEIGRRIAEHYVGFQCVYTLHKNTDYRHLHFIFNSVNYKDGKKFSQGPTDLNRIKTYCNTVLDEYNLDLISTKPMEMLDDGNYYFKNGYDFLEIHSDTPIKRKDIFKSIENECKETADRNAEYELFVGSCTTNESFFYPRNTYYGGNYMNNSTDFNAPAVQQSSSTIANPSSNSNGGLDLVTVNNVYLNSSNDLEAATRDISQSIYDNARVGAEALAVLREKGLDEGVRVATVNNFYVGSNTNQMNNAYDPYYNPFIK